MPVASYYSESAQYWYHAKKVGVVSALSIKSCTGPAVRQVVFTDVQITIRCSEIDQSNAPIGLHAASDWLLIKRHCIGKLPGVQVQNKSDNISYRRHFSIYRKDVLFQPKIRGASEKFKNKPRPLLRPRSVNFSQHFRNLSRETVPLNSSCSRRINNYILRHRVYRVPCFLSSRPNWLL